MVRFRIKDGIGDTEIRFRSALLFKLVNLMHDVITQLIAGGVSAVVAKTTTAPLERIRILQQTRSGQSSIDLIRSIYKTDGITAFWRGNVPALLRIFPTYALRLTLFDKFKRKDESIYSSILSGCTSAFVTLAFTYPLDVIRTQMAASSESRRLIATTRLLYQTRSLYKGFTINMIETVPYVGISLGSYDYLKRSHPAIPKFALAVSTCIAATNICYPLDTLRRFIVVHPGMNISSAISALLADGGWMRFYRGLPIAVLKSGPTVGIILTLNDYLRKIL